MSLSTRVCAAILVAASLAAMSFRATAEPPPRNILIIDEPAAESPFGRRFGEQIHATLDAKSVQERALKRYDDLYEQNVRFRSFRAHYSSLTPREREVFGLVVRGKLNKQIAFGLGTSERTIKAHRHSIMQKFEARSLAELVSIAEKLEMTGEPPTDSR